MLQQTNLKNMENNEKTQETPKNVKNIDIKTALIVDLQAAISLLAIIRDDKKVFERVLDVLEEYRDEMIRKEEALNEVE